MGTPIQLRIAAKKPRPLVGEDIVLEIAHTVSAELDMETVELNRSRTTLRIARDGGTPLVLTGADHAVLHRIHPLNEIGGRFHAPTGSAWSTELHLLQYTRPLSVGRYRIELSYRFGDTPQETVTTNAVDVEVVPAQLRGCEFRWFGGSAARETLAILWTARGGDDLHWVFQNSNGKDPGAILSSVDLGLAQPPDTRPRLAHLNDIATFHYERYAVWVERERLGWLKISEEHRLDEPKATRHGLDSESQLAEPPLQRRGGGFFAVVAGKAMGASRMSLVGVDGGGSARVRPIPGEHPANGQVLVAWGGGNDDVPQGNVFFVGPDRNSIACVSLDKGQARSLDLPGEALFLAVDQWLGQGRLLTLVKIENDLEVLCWDLAHLDTEPEVLSTYPGDKLPPGTSANELVEAAPLASGGLAVLFNGPGGGTILTPGKMYRLPAAKMGPNSRLIAATRGLFLYQHSSDQGFSATRLGEAPPPDPV